jgi:hypothetical protein
MGLLCQGWKVIVLAMMRESHGVYESQVDLQAVWRPSSAFLQVIDMHDSQVARIAFHCNAPFKQRIPISTRHEWGLRRTTIFTSRAVDVVKHQDRIVFVVKAASNTQNGICFLA